MTAAPQRDLPGFMIDARVKLVDMHFARAVFGCDEDSVLNMIFEGSIEWAFNVGSGERLREVRILKECLAGQGAKFATLSDVIEHLVPSNRVSLRSGELKEQWNCGLDLVDRLVKGRQLDGGVRGHTLWIDAQSAREFLERRRIF